MNFRQRSASAPMPRSKQEPQLQEEVEKLRMERQLAEEEVQRMAEEHMNALLQHVSTVERIKSTVRDHSLLRNIMCRVLTACSLACNAQSRVCNTRHATRHTGRVAGDLRYRISPWALRGVMRCLHFRVLRARRSGGA